MMIMSSSALKSVSYDKTMTRSTTTRLFSGDSTTRKENEKDEDNNNNDDDDENENKGWIPPSITSPDNNFEDTEIDEDDDNSDSASREWIPPMIRRNSEEDEEHDDDEDDASNNNGIETVSSSIDSEAATNMNNELKTILESSRQVKEQERYDTAIEQLEEEAEAIFQLSEHEQQTLTDEEILAKLDRVLQQEEELKEKQEAQAQAELQQQQQQEAETAPSKQLVGTDWLRNRRAVLLEGGGAHNKHSKNSNNKQQQQVPVIHHTMLKSDEIKYLLKINGGRDIRLILDDPNAQRMGGSGTLGMIFCTGSGGRGTDTEHANHPYLIYTLSSALIDHMKERKLQEIGVLGANQNTANGPQSAASSFSNPSSSWMIVDCGNYIVHILDAATRKQLQLEKLWSGKDDLWKVNLFDEDAVEDYCYHNPVPDRYGSSGSRRGEGGDLNSTITRRLENQSIYGTGRPKHHLAVSQSQRNRDRIYTNKQKRAQRELDHRSK